MAYMVAQTYEKTLYKQGRTSELSAHQRCALVGGVAMIAGPWTVLQLDAGVRHSKGAGGSPFFFARRRASVCMIDSIAS